MSSDQFIPALRRISTITQSSLQYIYLDEICTPDVHEDQDDLYKALGSKSRRDFYNKVAYISSDTEAELTDDETDDDTDDDTDNDTSSVEDIEDDEAVTDENTFRTPIQPVLTKHPGFPNLKYLHIGSYLGIAIFRYFCHKAEGGDQIYNLFKIFFIPSSTGYKLWCIV